MGRKIPGRKHHGVKDPEKQAAVRFDKIKDRINAPPTNPDDQQISKSLQKIIDLKNKVKTGIFDIKHKKKPKNKSTQLSNEKDRKIQKFPGKPVKPIPVFKQYENESNREFIRRVNKICMDVNKEAKFEEKYGVEIKRNEDGEVKEVVKRQKDELDLLITKQRKEDKNKGKKKKSKENEGPRLTKSQKWQKKKNEKKLKKKLQNVDEFEKYKDIVKFGEIVHAPPSLVVPKKVGKLQNVPRPGKKNLLLKSMMGANSEEKSDSLSKTINKSIDKTGKRKDLPHALRRQLDTQQKDIISAYKVLKAKKYGNR